MLRRLVASACRIARDANNFGFKLSSLTACHKATHTSLSYCLPQGNPNQFSLKSFLADRPAASRTSTCRHHWIATSSLSSSWTRTFRAVALLPTSSLPVPRTHSWRAGRLEREREEGERGRRGRQQREREKERGRERERERRGGERRRKRCRCRKRGGGRQGGAREGRGSPLMWTSSGRFLMDSSLYLRRFAAMRFLYLREERGG